MQSWSLEDGVGHIDNMPALAPESITVSYGPERIDGELAHRAVNLGGGGIDYTTYWWSVPLEEVLADLGAGGWLEQLLQAREGARKALDRDQSPLSHLRSVPHEDPHRSP
jgi:hypothetical protein